MLSPVPMPGGAGTAFVPDSYFGEHGSSLSEYAQLLWLFENIDNICSGYEYIRVFHYRRFVAINRPTKASQALNQPWSTVVKGSDLGEYEIDFDRNSNTELFNSRFIFERSVLYQYADAHILEDILNFARYISRRKILSDINVAEFLSINTMIPSCSIAVYKVATFKILFSFLRQAGEFINSDDFRVRAGYQRRVMGFLLERLNSYLLLALIGNKKVVGKFGHNIVISDSPEVTLTH